MQNKSVSSDIKDKDVVSDEYAVEYDISEVGKALSEIREIEGVMDNLKKPFYLINNSIKNARIVLHKLDKEEDLP